jgi:flagellin-like hook-associated protein FlgL
VTSGIQGSDTLGAADFAATIASEGTITVKNGANVDTFNWDASSTSVNNVLTFLNSVGVTASYDANGDKLTISGGPFELFETSSNDGVGFFEANGIEAGATGTAYTLSVQSSSSVTGGILLNKALDDNNFIGTPDTHGSIIVKREFVVQAFNWNASTTTPQEVLDFLNNEAGLSATYDADHHKLTVTGAGKDFELFEVTANGGTGYFGLHNISVPTTGTPYAGSVTSSGAATAPPGIILSQAANNNNFALPSDTGGTFVIQTSNGYSKQIKWSASDSVQTILNKLNQDSATSQVTFGYNADHSKMTVTKQPTLGSFTLGEVTDNGGPGYFDMNRINATTTGITYTTSISSLDPVTAGIDLNGTISASNNFQLTPDTGGILRIQTSGDAIGKSFSWDSTKKVGDLLNEINSAGLGVTVSYDATGHTLSVNMGAMTSYTLTEVTNNDGNGFFAINKIDASASGTTYSATVSSSAPVTSNTDAILSDPSRPITRYSYETAPGVYTSVTAGDVSINGVKINIDADDTLLDVVNKINNTSGDPGGAGHHVRAYYTEGTAATGDGKLYLKSTVWGEKIDLEDDDSTNFWNAMHIQDNSSGQALKFKRNGVDDTTGVARNLAAYVNPNTGYKVEATVAPGVQITFATNDDFDYGEDFFVGASASTAGHFSGPLSTSSIITVDPGKAEGSGISIVNNGFLNYKVSQNSLDDVGKVAYIKTIDPMLITEDNSLQFQVGADEGEIARLGIQDVSSLSLFGPNYTALVTTRMSAEDLIGQSDAALDVISGVNLHVGHFANVLDRTLSQQRSQNTGLSNGLSLMVDSDMSQEATTLARRQIIAQSAIAMQSQSNLNERLVLELIRQ